LKRGIRIIDIAAKAGVSPGTVDRVIHKRGRVAEEVYLKVQQVMEEMGYVPDPIASVLASKTARKLGALMPREGIDPYWELPMQGLKQGQTEFQYFGIELDPCFFDLNDPADFLKQGLSLLESRPQGLIFPPIFLQESQAILQRTRDLGIPTVLINTDLEEEKVLSYIGQNSYQSGRLAARLLQLNMPAKSKLLLLNLDKQPANAKHLLDKERGLREHLAEIQPGIEVFRFDFETFEDPMALSDFLHQVFQQQQFSGIYVSNSRAYKVLDLFYLQLPQYPRPNLLGYDLLPANLAYLNQGGISFLIHQNARQQGYLAIQTLVDHLVHKRPVERVQHLSLDVVVAENAGYYL
jgi:LacI family transcriptional regulator